MCSELFDFAADFFLLLAESLLQTAEELILFSLSKGEVIVRKVGILLLQFSFYLVPTAS